MTRRGRWWFVFAACAAAVLLGLAWTTMTAMRLERAEHGARVEADRQESIRLALWRMDSLVSPLIAYEGARPWFEYAPFYAPERGMTTSTGPYEPGEVVTLSPLLHHDGELFPLHFQIDGQGRFSSPQVPGDLRALGFGPEVLPDPSVIEQHRQRLIQLEGQLNRDALAVRLDAAEAAIGAAADSTPAASTRVGLPNPVLKSQGEAQKRAMSNVASQRRLQRLGEILLPTSSAPVIGPLVSLWCESSDDAATLLFVRRVRIDRQQQLQGFVADWPNVRRLLLDEIRDLFPEADLVAATGDTPAIEDATHMLATVPATLLVSLGPSVSTLPSWTPVRTTLVLVWLASLAALAAGAVTLRASIAYADKRSRFASAVTHELRTPLTTFRLYSQMLADGTIRDPEQRQRYLETLEHESGRLAHLVENVLAYARLEEGRAQIRREKTTVGRLLEATRDGLRQRADEASMTLEIRRNGLESTEVETDTEAVGQILLNLVDNACKYASAGNGSRLDLEVSRSGSELAFALQDRGPGIPPKHRETVFAPFHRGARDVGDKTPGIGLGLALSRGLARDLGGDLRLEATEGRGARFVFHLPAAS